MDWEKDLSKECYLDTWYNDFSHSYKGIINVVLMEASVKVITRWYLVPLWLAKMYSPSFPLCFRGCDLLGSMYHIWWEFPRIQNFLGAKLSIARCWKKQTASLATAKRKISWIMMQECMDQYFALLGP